MKTATQTRMIRALGTALVLASIAISTGCQRQHRNLIPRELEGVWTTDDPRYKDRFMELSQAFVIIVTGKNDVASVQLVNNVETTLQGSEMLLTVRSTDHKSGEQSTMNLRFNPQNGGELRFTNQAPIWKRRPPELPAKTPPPAKRSGKAQPPKHDPYVKK